MLVYKNPKKDSNITEVWYSNSMSTMYIYFNTNRIYKYNNISKYTYNKFIESKSKGKYFRQNIMNNKSYDVEELFK